MYFRQYKSGSNYAYLLADEETGEAITIDPITPTAILSDIKKKGLSLKYVINTHGHGDHTSGNRQVLSETTAQLAAHPLEGVGEDVALKDGMPLNVGSLTVRVLHTPGHTPGSICLVVNDEFLFSGDTLFLSGCGNCNFGGNVKDLYGSFVHKLKPLPDNLKVLSGHNYVDINVPFSVDLFASNPLVGEKQQQITHLTNGIEPQSTLGEEKAYNPFFNFDNPTLKNDLEQKTGKYVSLGYELFREVRSLKDRS